MKYGLIGERLGHSFSKEIHERLGYDYELKSIPRDELEKFICARDFLGINVTMPYKSDVIPYLDVIDGPAEEIGAVNTIVNREGKLYGYNTDFYGMRELLSHAEIAPAGKKVAILGSGGTSKTARALFKSLGADEIITVSRSGELGYDEFYKQHRDTEIIVNTTPKGMFPDIFDRPVDISGFDNLCGVIDAVYNPLDTTLVRDAKGRGIKAEAGLYMLVSQAVIASGLFLGTTYPSYTIDIVYEGLRAEKENIVLIGMPSSGKSTVGRLLSQMTGCGFIDTDELIEAKIKMPISDFFSLHGEDEFRRVEHEVVKEIAGLTGHVIATGGGVVLNENNIYALKYNGKIVFIDRPLDDLIATEDRPLSRDRASIEKLYNVRYPIYKANCDIHVNVGGSAKDVANDILENYL